MRAQAPALILHDVFEAELCRALIEYWHHGKHLDNMVATDDGP